jgi:hypothetical protein
MPRVVLAPDKFKGTLTAAEVAQHLADGIRSRRPDVELVTVPVADGGDGMPTRSRPPASPVPSMRLMRSASSGRRASYAGGGMP